ncbi:MAG: hypothetical protein ACRDRN_23490 [Sciscionella sp.]
MGAAHRHSFLPVWSRHAEAEGDRHLRAGMKPVSDLRRVFGWKLSVAGSGAEQSSATREGDRQIIADAVEAGAGARFILTEDVDDFAAVDLAAVRLSAVNPDLFMSHRLSREDYLAALRVLIRNRRRPSSTLPDIHAAIAKGPGRPSCANPAHRGSNPFTTRTPMQGIVVTLHRSCVWQG